MGLYMGWGGVPGDGRHGVRLISRGMLHLETVARDMGASRKGEDLVAVSVVVEVGAAADSHIWPYIWGGGGTWRRSPRGPPDAEGHAPPRDGGKGHGGNWER